MRNNSKASLAVVAAIILFGFVVIVYEKGGHEGVTPTPIKASASGTALPTTVPLPLATSQPATLTMAQILTIVETARSKISDLTVSFTFDKDHPDENDPLSSDFVRVIKQGEKLSVDENCGMNPGINSDLHERKITYDGRLCSSSDPRRNVAMISSSRRSDCVTKGLGFFDLAMLNDPVSDGRGSDDQCLVSALRWPGSILRPRTDVVDGIECYVVDVTLKNWEKNGETEMTLWLDPKQGFLPARAIYYIGSKPMMEMRIDTAAEILPGLWLPLTGRKIVSTRADLGPLGLHGQTHDLIVDREGNGKPSIRINGGVDAAVFQPWLKWPKGTAVFDSETGANTTIGKGTQFDDMLKAASSRPSFMPGLLKILKGR